MFAQAFKDLTPINIEDVANAPGLLNPPSVGEYLSTHVAQAFEDYTTPGRALEERSIMQAEKDAGQYDASYYAYDPQTQTPRPANAFAMSQEDWKASEWFREGIQYADNMTPTRARILAENFDLRRYRETIIAAGDEAFSLPIRALGFGAMLLGGLPDPINLIPFSGGMRGAKVAVSTALRSGKSALGAGVLAGLKTGAVEGTLGGAASMGLTMPDLAAKGEDIGFVDVFHGLTMSAALGSLLGGAGGALSAYRGVKAHRELQTRIDAELRRLRESEEAAKLEAELRGNYERIQGLVQEEFSSPDNGYLRRFGYDDTPLERQGGDTTASALNAPAASPADDFLGGLYDAADRAAEEHNTPGSEVTNLNYGELREAVQSRYDQLRNAGLSHEEAWEDTSLMAANANVMSPIFGMTPRQYVEARYPDFIAMSQKEFDDLGRTGLDGLFSNREVAEAMEAMGVTRNMTQAQRRRQLDPEWAYVYGRVDRKSAIEWLGMEGYKDALRQFGPGFFAKKGEGRGLDNLAQGFMLEERGGYGNASDIDEQGFVDKVFRSHEEFERGLAAELQKGALRQFIGERGAGRLDAAQTATMRLDNLAVARDLESAGSDARAIKLATGWERGADGKWRYEISDDFINAEMLDELRENRKKYDFNSKEEQPPSMLPLKPSSKIKPSQKPWKTPTAHCQPYILGTKAGGEENTIPYGTQFICTRHPKKMCCCTNCNISSSRRKVSPGEETTKPQTTI